MSFYKNFQLYQQGTKSTAATDALRFFLFRLLFFSGFQGAGGEIVSLNREPRFTSLL